METVWLAINARGDVMFVFSDRAKGDTMLRRLKCHPDRNGRGANWYVDAGGDYVFQLKEFYVTD